MEYSQLTSKDCYFELPELEIDYARLWASWYAYSDKGSAYNSPEYGVLYDTDRIDMDFFADPYCRSLVNQINSQDKIYEKFIWFNGEFKLWPHIDDGRRATILVPMYPIPQQVAYWCDSENNRIASKVLVKPTLYNVRIAHTFEQDGRDRLNFHLSLYEDYYSLLEKAESKTLIVNSNA